MAYTPTNPNGQAAMVSSSPVVIASNQSAVPISGQISTNGTVFAFSTANSTTVQLAASATFTGTIENVSNNQSYSFLFFSDQPATLTILQYIDAAGLKLISTLSFPYTANAAFARSGVANGNYVKVTAQNTGASTTTTLQLETAFGTIPSATQLNNSPSAINEINGSVVDTNSGNKSAGTQRFVLATDQPNLTAPLNVSLNEAELGLPVGMTSLRDLTTAQRYTTWGDSIADGVSIDWAQTVSNGGTITVVTGEGLLQTSANAIGTAQLVGPVINYYPGQVDWVNSAVRLGDLGSTGNARRWGRFTVSGNIPQDGFAFELIDTVFYATSFKGGVATRVATTSWTKFSTAPYTLDLNYLGAEIRFASNSCQFYVNNILRHTASGGSTAITNTLNLPIASQNINTAGATNRILAIRNIGQGRFGDAPLSTQPVTYSVVINNLAPALTATDIVTIYGSATKTVNIVNVIVSGIQTTASQALFLLTKRSTANAGGTSSVPTRAVYDSNDPAATATVLAYTANPTTLGTSVGNIRGDRAFLPGAASASDAQGIDWSFTATKNIVLRGATQGLAINLGGITITGGSINVTIEWTES